MNTSKIGEQIALLRKNKGLTQAELGEQLNITFQAVSKWERGETLPDTAVLLDLATALDTTVDYILIGGESRLAYKGRMAAKDVMEGIHCLERVGCLLGKQNPIYLHAIDGISRAMNTDIHAMLADAYTKECLAAEAMIQSMQLGYYFDMAEVKKLFRHEKWYLTVCDYAKQYGLYQS